MEVIEISVAEAKEMIARNKKNADFVILDVRTPEEFVVEHLSGAMNIDIHDDDFPEKIGKLDRTKTYLVHCRSGNRSRAAVELMLEMGFRDVYNVKGWMF